TLFAVVLCAAAISGCSASTLPAGSILAKAGQIAANQMDQNVTISTIQMKTLQEAVAFNDGYNNAIGNPNSSQYLTNFALIQKGLVQYGRWLESLSACYGALGDLASNDAAGNFNSSIKALANDTQKFAGAIGQPITIPSGATSTVGNVGGFLI